jgi:hypothetical protein
MKHLYQKYTLRFAVLFLAAFGLLTWAGCSNVFTPPPPQESGLRITVTTGMENPRTLYPDASFTKYVLSFSGPADHEDITLQDGQTSAAVSDLAVGQWTITAIGYVTIDGAEYPAAQGSVQITIAAGSFQTITIPISASREGDNGFFSYTVSYPQAMVDTAQLWVYRYGTNQSGEPVDLTQNPADTISLAPGYYMMTIRLSNDNYTAGRAEVVHIYANMETKAEYTFVENDFARTITLSGTVDITVDGEPLDENRHVGVHAYRDASYSDWVFTAMTDWRGNTWSEKIAPFDTDTPLYFTVNFETNFGNVEKRIGLYATAKDQNIANINIVYNQIVVTLSGTVNVTVNGAAPQGTVNVWASRNADYSDGVAASATVNLQDNTWSMQMLPFDTDTPLYFRIYYRDGNSGGVTKGTSVNIVVKDQSRDDINLGAVNVSALILSGTVDITIDGEPLDEWRSVSIIAYRNADYSGDQLLYSWVSLWNDNTWSATLDPFEDDTPLYFELRFDTDWGYLTRGTGVHITAKDQSIDNIGLAYNLPILTLSGTVNVTVNETVPNGNVYVDAYRNADYSDGVASATVNLQDNTWSIRMLPFETDTPLYFAVWFNSGNRSFTKGTGVNVTAKDQNINNINLGAVNFNAITLSGTVAVTFNGEAPNNYMNVSAYRDADYSNYVNSAWVNLEGGNTWSMVLESSDTDTPLYFRVQFETNSGGFVTRGTGVSVTVRDQDIPGIAIVCDFTD